MNRLEEIIATEIRNNANTITCYMDYIRLFPMMKIKICAELVSKY